MGGFHLQPIDFILITKWALFHMSTKHIPPTIPFIFPKFGTALHPWSFVGVSRLYTIFVEAVNRVLSKLILYLVTLKIIHLLRLIASHFFITLTRYAFLLPSFFLVSFSLLPFSSVLLFFACLILTSCLLPSVFPFAFASFSLRLFSLLFSTPFSLLVLRLLLDFEHARNVW